MRTLYISLTKKWFDMIASGQKLEEYRAFTTYWITRLMESDRKTFKEFDIVEARNGYGNKVPFIRWKHKGIELRAPDPAHPEWYPKEEAEVTNFVLLIGEVFHVEHPPKNINTMKLRGTIRQRIEGLEVWLQMQDEQFVNAQFPNEKPNTLFLVVGADEPIRELTIENIIMDHSKFPQYSPERPTLSQYEALYDYVKTYDLSVNNLLLHYVDKVRKGGPHHGTTSLAVVQEGDNFFFTKFEATIRREAMRQEENNTSSPKN